MKFVKAVSYVFLFSILHSALPAQAMYCPGIVVTVSLSDDLSVLMGTQVSQEDRSRGVAPLISQEEAQVLSARAKDYPWVADLIHDVRVMTTFVAGSYKTQTPWNSPATLVNEFRVAKGQVSNFDEVKAMWGNIPARWETIRVFLSFIQSDIFPEHQALLEQIFPYFTRAVTLGYQISLDWKVRNYVKMLTQIATGPTPGLREDEIRALQNATYETAVLNRSATQSGIKNKNVLAIFLGQTDEIARSINFSNTIGGIRSEDGPIGVPNLPSIR